MISKTCGTAFLSSLLDVVFFLILSPIKFQIWHPLPVCSIKCIFFEYDNELELDSKSEPPDSIMMIYFFYWAQCGVNCNGSARVLLQSSKPSLHANFDCNSLSAAIVGRQISVVRLLLQVILCLKCHPNLIVKLQCFQITNQHHSYFMVRSRIFLLLLLLSFLMELPLHRCLIICHSANARIGHLYSFPDAHCLTLDCRLVLEQT